MNARAMLWTKLSEAGLVEGEAPEPGAAHAPWYVRVMLGIAGWIGALFLIGFVGAGFAFVMKSAAAAAAVGAGACAVAAAIFRAAPKSDFMAQFGLAVALAGQGLLMVGIVQWLPRSGSNVALAFAVQQAVLFFLIPSYIHRLLCAWGGSLAVTWLIVDAGLFPLAPAAVTGAFLWLWLSELELARHAHLVRPAGYGLALAAMQTAIVHGGLWWVLMSGIGHGMARPGSAAQWLGHAASAAVLLWAVLRLLRREGLAIGSGQGRVALAGAAILALASLEAPGVGPAAAILVVGYANGNRVLAGLGILALLGYLSHYYYALHATLLAKSGLLAATGIALLAARLAMQRLWPEQKEAVHA